MSEIEKKDELNDEKLASDFLDKLKAKLKEVDNKYNTLIDQLEKKVQIDRQHAQDTYNTIKQIVINGIDISGKTSPGILQSLNSAVTNLQNSTQREKEILQLIAKKQQQLEMIYEMSKPQENDEGFDKDDFIE